MTGHDRQPELWLFIMRDANPAELFFTHRGGTFLKNLCFSRSCSFMFGELFHSVENAVLKKVSSKIVMNCSCCQTSCIAINLSAKLSYNAGLYGCLVCYIICAKSATREEIIKATFETYKNSQVHQPLYPAYPSLSDSSSPKALARRFHRKIAPCL